MLAKDVMCRTFSCCRPETSMLEAAGLMWHQGLAYLPVITEDSKVVGVVSESDLKAASSNKAVILSDLPVEMAMTRRICYCSPDTPIEIVDQLLRETGLRRIPVLDARMRLCGLITRADINWAYERERLRMLHQLENPAQSSVA